MGQITIGGVLIEVYGSESGANAYLAAATNGTAWSTLTVLARQQALVTATRLLERQRWAGDPTQPVSKTQPQTGGTQPLQWPRTGLVDRNGDALSSATIPQDVIDAAYELAVSLSASSSTLTQTQGQVVGVKSNRDRKKVAELEIETDVEYFAAGVQSRLSSRFPLIVEELIGLWLAGSAAASGVGLGSISGSGCESIFNSRRTYGYTNTGIN